MHLFDFFGRPKAPPAAPAAVPTSPAARSPEPPPAAPPGPTELRRMIFNAVASGDAERLTCLCRDHEGDILAHAADWMRVPDGLRSNPEAMRWYGEGLRTVARFCADSLDRPDLFQRLEELGLGTQAVH